MILTNLGHGFQNWQICLKYLGLRIVHCATRENKCFSHVAHDVFSTGVLKNGFFGP